MSKFQVGDRVRVKRAHGYYTGGKEGVVKRIDFGSPLFRVEFEVDPFDERSGPADYGFAEEELVLLSQPAPAPDSVTVALKREVTTTVEEEVEIRPGDSIKITHTYYLSEDNWYRVAAVRPGHVIIVYMSIPYVIPLDRIREHIVRPGYREVFERQ